MRTLAVILILCSLTPVVKLTGNATTSPDIRTSDARHAPVDPRSRDALSLVACANLPASDARPVIEGWTVPRQCKPCAEFDVWHKANHATAPFRFKLYVHEKFNDLPKWVYEQSLSVPLFRFTGSDGKRWYVRQGADHPGGGWPGIKEVERQWKLKNSGVK